MKTLRCDSRDNRDRGRTIQPKPEDGPNAFAGPAVKMPQSHSGPDAQTTATRVVILAKAPRAGRVKTRLIPALGRAGAARLAQEMLLHTVREATGAGLGVPELCASPDPRCPEWEGHLPPPPVHLTSQGEGDLGARMARAAERVIGEGERILLIGTDCPALDCRKLVHAASQLERHDAVIQPTLDGGYALLGLARFDPSLFMDIAWSTSSVARQTLARIWALGWSCSIGAALRDIDEPGDLLFYRRRMFGDAT